MTLSIYQTKELKNYLKLSSCEKEKYVKTHWIHKDGHLSKKHAMGKLLNKWIVTRGLFQKVFGINFHKTINQLIEKKAEFEKQGNQDKYNEICEFLKDFIQHSHLKEKNHLIATLNGQKFTLSSTPLETPHARVNPPPKPEDAKSAQSVGKHSAQLDWAELWNENPADKEWFDKHFSRQNAQPPAGFKTLSPEEFLSVRDFFQDPSNYEKLPVSPGRRLPHLEQNHLNSLCNQEWLSDTIVKAFSAHLLNQLDVAGKGFDKGYILDPHIFIDLYNNNYDFSGASPSLFEHLPAELFSKGKLLIPIHQLDRSHWTLIQVNFEKKKITSYDSLGNQSNIADMKKVKDWMDYWIQQKKLPKIDWSMEDAVVPKQNNGSDCGAFTCSFMDAITTSMIENKEPEFTINAMNMPFYRLYMLYSISRRYVKKNSSN